MEAVQIVSRILFVIVLVLAAHSYVMSQKTTSGFAEVNGTTLYYELQGKGFPVVFVSGGGILDRRGWELQFEVFAKHYKAIRYDIRGLGKSARPQKSFSHSEDLYALLKFLKIKRAHLVGLSMGGAIVIDFALEHPDMVDHLVLAASGLSDDVKAGANMQGLAVLEQMTKQQGLERLIEVMLGLPFVITQGNESAKERIRTNYLDNRDVFESGFPVYMLWEPTRPAASARLPEVRAKTLIVRGDADNPVYSELTDKIIQGVKHAKVVVIRGGTHFINLDKPQEFNEDTLAFLRE